MRCSTAWQTGRDMRYVMLRHLSMTN